MHQIKISRIALVVLLVVMVATVAEAYTVVMHGGRRVEVPSTFVLTQSTLTYEVSPGVQITLPLAAIDIVATEQANGEASGSFMRRLQQGEAEGEGHPGESRPVRSTGQKRTITNRDLEPMAKRRRDSEDAYEIRRKQLQLPSVAESREKAARESAAFSLELEQKRMAQSEAESYWRERASALRTEIAAVDEEIAFVRMKLDDSWGGGTSGWSSASVNNPGFIQGFPSLGYGGWGYGGYGSWGSGNQYGGRYRGAGRNRQNIYVAPGNGGRSRGHFGGQRGNRSRGFFNWGGSRHGQTFGVDPFWGYPNAGVVGVGAPAYDYSYERSELITRFNELGGQRAALGARWRELENEARRAGAPPGWLRP